MKYNEVEYGEERLDKVAWSDMESLILDLKERHKDIERKGGIIDLVTLDPPLDNENMSKLTIRWYIPKSAPTEQRRIDEETREEKWKLSLELKKKLGENIDEHM